MSGKPPSSPADEMVAGAAVRSRSEIEDGRSNCFDLLRLLLALMVVYTHAHLLGGFGSESFTEFTRGQTNAGRIAVIGFFGISGFLVARSFALRGRAIEFVRARALRILPGFYLALALTAFALAPLISYCNTASEGWTSGEAAQFIFRNMLLQIREWHVGGVLSGLPYPGSINGALWSLFPECCCYLILLILGLSGALQGGRINALALMLLVWVLHLTITIAPENTTLAPTLLSLTGLSGFVTAFLVGVAVYCYQTQFAPGARQALLWWLIAAVLLKFGGWLLLEPIVLPIALIHTAHSVHVRIPADLSYGIYIFHFPVLQLLSAMGAQHQGFSAYLALGLAITGLIAAFSWYCVEKPALQFKKRNSTR